jgi:hypothetical protein
MDIFTVPLLEQQRFDMHGESSTLHTIIVTKIVRIRFCFMFEFAPTSENYLIGLLCFLHEIRMSRENPSPNIRQGFMHQRSSKL